MGSFIVGLVIPVHLKLEHGEFYRRTSYTRPFKGGTWEFYRKTSYTRPFKVRIWGVSS